MFFSRLRLGGIFCPPHCHSGKQNFSARAVPGVCWEASGKKFVYPESREVKEILNR